MLMEWKLGRVTGVARVCRLLATLLRGNARHQCTAGIDAGQQERYTNAAANMHSQADDLVALACYAAPLAHVGRIAFRPAVDGMCCCKRIPVCDALLLC